MTRGLVRKHDRGDFHSITFSFDRQNPYPTTPEAWDLAEDALERMRLRSLFVLAGYVVMPNHVHLLMSEPENGALVIAIQGIKVSVSKRRPESPFWLSRYYDFNVFSSGKRIEKLRYMHRNPVAPGLVEKPEDWSWSRFRHYAFGENRGVEVESDWTAARRDRHHSTPP
jgi:putative transposase